MSMDLQTNPLEQERISVTLKQDGKDGTWIVFHGSPAMIRSQIMDVFDLTEGEEDAPLFDLINEATRLYKAAGNVSSSLGGRVIPKSTGSGAGRGSAWEKVAGGESVPAEPEVDPNVVRLTNAIEGATDVAALKELYARNEAHFAADASLTAAWKAKGKSLSS